MATDKGKHVGSGNGPFYRDLTMMIGSIIVIGAAVFFLLFLIADGSTPASTAPAAVETSPTSTQPTTTTAPSTTTTAPSTTATAPSTTEPLTPPEEIRVAVLNSSEIDGAAGRLAAQLDDAGYQTVPVGDYDPPINPSRIWHRSCFTAEANLLLDFIPDAAVQPLPRPGLEPDADVIIILGAEYEE